MAFCTACYHGHVAVVEAIILHDFKNYKNSKISKKYSLNLNQALTTACRGGMPNKSSIGQSNLNMAVIAALLRHRYTGLARYATKFKCLQNPVYKVNFLYLFQHCAMSFAQLFRMKSESATRKASALLCTTKTYLYCVVPVKDVTLIIVKYLYCIVCSKDPRIKRLQKRK